MCVYVHVHAHVKKERKIQGGHKETKEDEEEQGAHGTLLVGTVYN